MSVKELVRAWREVSKGQRPADPDAFFRFVAAWVAFNATYVYCYGADVGDRAGAIRFASEPNSLHRHNELLQLPSYRAAVEVLAEKGVLNLRNGRTLRINNSADFIQVMEVIYQVRCNLFRGGKLPSDPRDLRLVEAANAVLQPHLDNCWP